MGCVEVVARSAEGVCVCWEGCWSRGWGWVSFCGGGSRGCGIDVKVVRVGAVRGMAWMGI